MKQVSTPQPPKKSTTVWSLEKLQIAVRTGLEQEFQKRTVKNKSYSLRAFAKALSIDPSTLSQVLSGKRGLSFQKCEELAKRAGLQVHFFVGEPQTPETSKNEFRTFGVDSFMTIANWEHFTIIQLMQLPQFKQSFGWIGRALGITAPEAKKAIKRLMRVGLIQEQPDGKWKLMQDAVTTVGNPFTHSAFRTYQKQILEKALQALEETPFEKRDQTSMAFRFPTHRLPEMSEDLKQFRRAMAEKYQDDPSSDEVYQLSLSFFPLSNTKRTFS